jgi:RNA polymerase sigma-70 factor (ECF subfamily)
VPVADVGPAAGDRRDVHLALATIPEGQRAALILVDWLDMDAEEAAGVLGIKPGSVRVRLHRARSALRDSLGVTS